MKVKILTVTLILAISSAPVSAICYLCDRSDWQNANHLEKLGFVMGVVAEHTVHALGQEQANAYSTDLTKCVLDLGLKSTDLVDIVDQKYLDLEKWEYPPHIALGQGLRDVCLAHMNRARAERGADLLSP